MTIELKPEQERILREALREGRFDSVDEALDTALKSIASPIAARSLADHPTPAEAASRLRELRRGTVLPPGATIRSLIEQGRA
jgi:Arc/MetJ-type ribon-helix-helix transcriptional regulator